MKTYGLIFLLAGPQQLDQSDGWKKVIKPAGIVLLSELCFSFLTAFMKKWNFFPLTSFDKHSNIF